MKTDQLHSPVIPGSEGFVFATTGEKYTTLARRAARTLREVMPGCLVDIFTDQALEDDVFDRIHRLNHNWFRPKMQAVRESRFERSIIMDADIVVVVDISEVFRILDCCDIAGVEGHTRREPMMPANSQVPRCFPPINSGFLAVRASPRMHAFAQAWEDDVRGNASNLDQPSFRRLLYQSDLRFLPLGGEYNTINLNKIDIWHKMHGAPRVLHVRELHMRSAGNPLVPISLNEAIGPKRAAHVANLLATDWTLGGDPTGHAPPPIEELRKSLNSDRDKQPAQTPPADSSTSIVRRIFGSVTDISQLLIKKLRKHNAGQPAGTDTPAGSGKSGSPYWSAILQLSSFRDPLRICIVGANDGKFGDPIFSLIERELTNKTDVLLFEPQSYLIPYLSQNYAFHPSHHIVNAAVGPGSDLVLYTVREEAWGRISPAYARNWPAYRAATGITSTEYQIVLDWIKKNAPEESEPHSLIVELKVPCSRLSDSLAQLGRPERIDVLQVDAEGFDDEVIYACDLNSTRPSIIFYEESHLGEDRRRNLRKYLETDYRLMPVKRDVLAIRRA